MNPDGSDVRSLVTVTGIGGLYVDPYHNTIYFADSTAGTIFRTDLSGNNRFDLVTGLTAPQIPELYFETSD